MKLNFGLYNTKYLPMQIKVWNILAMVATAVMAIAVAGCGDVNEERIESSAYIQTTDVKGESKNCAVVLRAQQGTSYSITIQSEGDWATFSSGLNTTNGRMDSVDRVVYIYFDKNATGEARSASVEVNFSDATNISLYFTQQSYDNSVAYSRAWAELPLCKSENGYIFNSHYGKLGLNNDARNYTYCFDPSVRASLWVAYPLHKSHMTGDGNRNNSEFGYDPTISTAGQADLSRSYSGRYDRGHQLPAADMTPQHSNFNQNKWGVLEGRVRNMVCSDTLYVVTGAYFEGSHDLSINSQTTDRAGNVCPTPTYYYKALLRTKKGNTGKTIDEIGDANQLRAIAFWFTHADTGSDTNITSKDCISVAELEERTGFTFFPMIDDVIEAQVKSVAVPSEWGIN